MSKWFFFSPLMVRLTSHTMTTIFQFRGTIYYFGGTHMCMLDVPPTAADFFCYTCILFECVLFM